MNGIKELFIFAVWLKCMCFNMPGIITAFTLTNNVRSRDNRCNPQSIVHGIKFCEKLAKYSDGRWGENGALHEAWTESGGP